MEDFGIIILRHVSTHQHNELWKESYKCARNAYPNEKIVIIDDNSNKKFLHHNDLNLTNYEIIESSYPGRGELLPYIYLLEHKWFKTSLIIHDSVFIQNKIEYNDLNNTFIPLWSFNSNCCSQDIDQIKIINTLDNKNDLITYHNSKEWSGIFGGMTIISLEFLQKVDKVHCLKNMLNCITNRHNRMSFERVLAILLHYHNDSVKISKFGDLFKFFNSIKFSVGSRFNRYKSLKTKISNIYKVWSGR